MGRSKQDKRNEQNKCQKGRRGQQHGKESYLKSDENFSEFSDQLSAVGLKLRDIPGDGNCLFRALADQLEERQVDHKKHRQATVMYMIQQKEDFEPFVEGSFSNYIDDLGRDGTYAGNDAIVAFAQNNEIDVVIHQLNAPVWTVIGDKKKKSNRQLHIAYHNGDHYSSVRSLNNGTPSSIKLVDDKSLDKKQKIMKEKIKKVRKVTGFKDDAFIEETLEDCDENVEYTINIIKQIQKSEDILNVEETKQKNMSKGEATSSNTKPRQRKKDKKQEKKARATERKREAVLAKTMQESSDDDSSNTQNNVLIDKIQVLKI